MLISDVAKPQAASPGLGNGQFGRSSLNGFSFQDYSAMPWVSVFEAENSFFDMKMPP
jgi:hypothetical protein